MRLQETAAGLRADFVIVGAGSAGCALAGRLSENPATSVILIEAGGHTDNLLIRNPALSLLHAIGSKKYDWNLHAAPDPTRGGKRSEVNRGRGLGGSSAINGMVYFRGFAEDFDHWAQLGNQGWGWNDVERCYRRMEAVADGGEDRGTDGPQAVQRIRTVHPLTRDFVAAAEAFGLERDDGIARAGRGGVGLVHATQRRGMRVSAAEAYIYPVLKSRPNLTVVTDASVSRVVFDGTAAIGVAVLDGEGRERIVRADREVVLSAGAVATPHLLVSSGIGSAEAVATLGRPLIAASPGVGENLQDHVEVALVRRVTGTTVNQQSNLAWQAIHGARWLMTRNGPAASPGADALAVVRTRPELSVVDMLIYFGPYVAGLEEAGVVLSREAGITADAGLMHPRSRSRLNWSSGDPSALPDIEYRLLDDPEDTETLLRGLRITEKIFEEQPLALHITGAFAPDHMVMTDDGWRAYIRETARPSLHLSGTCRMGRDPAAVVAPDLRVNGVERLRVVDASVIPAIPACNLNAVCIMIGERAAELITAERQR